MAGVSDFLSYGEPGSCQRYLMASTKVLAGCAD